MVSAWVTFSSAVVVMDEQMTVMIPWDFSRLSNPVFCCRLDWISYSVLGQKSFSRCNVYATELCYTCEEHQSLKMMQIVHNTCLRAVFLQRFCWQRHRIESLLCMHVCTEKDVYLVLADTVGWNVSYGSTQPLKAVSFWYLVCVCQRCLAAVASVVKIVNITSSVSIYNHHECQFTQFLGN